MAKSFVEVDRRACEDVAMVGFSSSEHSWTMLPSLLPRGLPGKRYFDHSKVALIFICQLFVLYSVCAVSCSPASCGELFYVLILLCIV